MHKTIFLFFEFFCFVFFMHEIFKKIFLGMHEISKNVSINYFEKVFFLNANI